MSGHHTVKPRKVAASKTMRSETINGVEVNDVEDLANAFSHLKKDYNDGELSVYKRSGDSEVVEGSGFATHIGITGRSRIMRNSVHKAIQKAEFCHITTIACREGVPHIEVKDTRVFKV